MRKEKIWRHWQYLFNSCKEVAIFMISGDFIIVNAILSIK